MRLDVQKWEDSAVVRLPSAALEAAGIRIGERLELRIEAGRLVIEPAAASLDIVLANITTDNLHDLQMDGSIAGSGGW